MIELLYIIAIVGVGIVDGNMGTVAIDLHTLMIMLSRVRLFGLSTHTHTHTDTFDFDQISNTNAC